jgi:hypothetical protein
MREGEVVVRGSVFRIARDRAFIICDCGSKLTCSLQRYAEIHVSWSESLVRLDGFAETSKRFYYVAGCLRGNTAVHELLRQPVVGRRHFRAAAPQQIPE